MGQCLVYDPSGPRLYTVNTTTWLVLLLCASATREAVVAAFHHEVEPLLTCQEAAEYVDEALADLVAKRLIEPSMAACDLVLETMEGG